MRLPFLIILFLLLGIRAPSQIFHLPNFGSVDIPFEYSNDFIIVTIRFQHAFPLKFIFDTGAEHTILTKKEISELLGIPYLRQFNIVGSDMQQELVAHLIAGVHLGLGDELALPNQSLLVLDDDYFRFEEFTGIQVHGILGANIFRGFVVKINYRKNLITLINPKVFEKSSKNYSEHDISIIKNKPYFLAEGKLGSGNASLPLKLLLDTGASMSLLLHNNSSREIEMPDHVIKGNIGKGLGGFLEGYLGRTSQLILDQYVLEDVLTNYQELTPRMDTAHLNGRNGIIGNQILSRFNLILDYPHEKIYLSPNKEFDKPFKYDRSGLVIIAGGYGLNKFTVNEIVPGSPAEEAGMIIGDEILKINWFPAWALSLDDITRILKKREGKKILLKVRRGDEVLRIRFRLKELI